MTNQEIFDRVLNGIVAQGRPSVRVYTCQYRSDDGAKCAIGHLIADEDYRVTLEGAAVDTFRVRDALAPTIGRSAPLALLAALQSAHDRNSARKIFLAYFRDSMKDIAQQFGLKYSYDGE